MEKQPLLSHLDELLIRARRIFLWIFVGCAISYFYATELLELIWAPTDDLININSNLIFTRPFEKVWVLIRLSLVAGIALMSPFIAYEVMAFVRPALKEHEKKKAIFLLISFSISFVVGLIFGYLYILPAIMSAVMRFGGQNIQALFTVSSYVNTSLGILLLSALFFEIPVMMLHLSSWGWVSSAKWAQGRKLALVINSIVSAFLSPPDPLSMIIMMIPLQILYEAGVQISRVAEYKREKQDRATI